MRAMPVVNSLVAPRRDVVAPSCGLTPVGEGRCDRSGLPPQVSRLLDAGPRQLGRQGGPAGGPGQLALVERPLPGPLDVVKGRRNGPQIDRAGVIGAAA